MDLEVYYTQKHASNTTLPIPQTINTKYKVTLRTMDNRSETIEITCFGDILKYVAPHTGTFIDMKNEKNINGYYKLYDGITILVMVHYDNPRPLSICQCDKSLNILNSVENFGLYEDIFTSIKLTNNRYICGFPKGVKVESNGKKFIVFSHSVHGSELNYYIKKYCGKELLVDINEFIIENCYELIYSNKTLHYKVKDIMNINNVLDHIELNKIEIPKKININNKLSYLDNNKMS